MPDNQFTMADDKEKHQSFQSNHQYKYCVCFCKLKICWNFRLHNAVMVWSGWGKRTTWFGLETKTNWFVLKSLLSVTNVYLYLCNLCYVMYIMLIYVCQKQLPMTSGFILDTNSGLLIKGPVLVHPCHRPCTPFTVETNSPDFLLCSCNNFYSN